MTKKRLFVGNLPENVNEFELSEKFSDFGNVESVELKVKPSGCFAFVDIHLNTKNIDDCLYEISKKSWRGNKITVQLAKESFLSRLERERNEIKNKTKSVTEGTSNETKLNGTINKLPMFQGTNSENEKEIKNPKPEKLRKKINEEENDSEIKIKKPEREKNENKFSNEVEEKETTYKKKKERNSLPKQNFKEEFIHNNKKKERNSLPQQNFKSDINNVLLDKSKVESDIKRQNAFNERVKAYKDQKKILKDALSNIDSKNSKKIIFDSDDETEKVQSENKKEKVKDLLFSDSEDDNEKDDISRFEIKPQFQGEKGQRLLELQSKYNNDPRFVLDERFQQDDDENENEEEKDWTVNKQESEKDQQIKILEEVLGHSVNLRQHKQPKIMQRFDPCQPEHLENFVVKKEVKFEEKKNKKKEKKKKKEDDDEKNKEDKKVEVSKERFFQTDGLKNSLQKKEESEGFSLLKMFGDENKDVDIEDRGMKIEKKEIKEENKKKVLTKLNSLTSNPFKYDSSSGEEEEVEKKEEPRAEIVPVKAPRIAQGIRQDTFFLLHDDIRFAEAWQCISKKDENDTKTRELSDWRRSIRSATRLKRKNAEDRESLRNNKKRKYITTKKSKKFNNNKLKKKF